MIEFLIAYPVIAVLVAVMLLVIPRYLCLSVRAKRVVGFCGISWLLYSIYELALSAYSAQTGIIPVRNDMYILGPPLLLLALIGVLTIGIGGRNAT